MSDPAGGVPVSAEERLAALLHSMYCAPMGFGPDECVGSTDDNGCIDRARRLIAARVSVPTEPGAPDPLEAVQIAMEGLGGYPVPPEGIDWAWVHRGDLLNALASRPAPAPEPSARLREALRSVGSIRKARAALAATPQDPEA